MRPRVEVKVGRRGRALEIDGTFASWYEPGLPITGSVWDALAAPLLALPPARRRDVLVLGLGGGSVARVVRALAPQARIVGVEMSGEVLRAARRWLELDALDVEVVRADARVYLQRARRRYDLVIEDLFVGRGRAVHKPDWLPDPGLEWVRRRLAPGGLLVSNTIDEAAPMAAALARHFRGLISIEVEDYDNRVLVAGGRQLTARGLRAALGADPILGATLPRLKLRTLAGQGRRRARAGR
ncbi:MAG: fused MFS/spermidine synthase [Deltaproteobacteria bacterium]|nr:fused MFS/spermidine synthase [Deltaproteobacteria bacterium]MBW2362537.1 fused MFS/spermidine synthase [Deltaproteobacteria bacterium]